MKIPTEALRQFYERTHLQLPANLSKRSSGESHFNVKRRSCLNRLGPCNRRDYYKICFTTGTGIYRFMKKRIFVNQPAVIFHNPLIPSSWESVSAEQDGYYCLFNDAFLVNSIKREIRYSSGLFNPAINPVILLDEVNASRIENYFLQLESLVEMDYTYKYEMIRNVLHLLILEGIRLQSHLREEHRVKRTDRIVTNFFDLLNKQFPVDSPENPLTLISPSQ